MEKSDEVIKKVSRVTLATLASVMLAVGSFALGVKVGDSEEVPPVPKDPRAYAVDSGDLTFDQGANRAELAIPECIKGDLQYALIDDGFGYHHKTYIKVVTSEDCANEFLRLNSMEDSLKRTVLGGADEERPIESLSVWMSGQPVDQMGWRFQVGQQFHRFVAPGKSNLYVTKAYVQYIPNSTTVRLYVFSEHGG